ncbi:uncharacterized protein L969DRAFT_95115 [Mixia osmundae IAM 14324]|uniref:Uncharacterized protein n=1 Tax=Mixia osmundae (strain CBS 9802 / IAM 14324 / JCM 22182 / KY 12970) TaxID=764103 RepID=G7E749_MIXOS|nr:uncharacterized protein L969DRAFT_95115 [Mixia osmundae IAM 14324]KEI38955.1 hypothetical protein L969DRAFT_95115 [Mixia osmundae IAM 14324]GAA98659.1 hypothetical protein E5Q_05347 [Mixia osmundae IAM 14324]
MRAEIDHIETAYAIVCDKKYWQTTAISGQSMKLVLYRPASGMRYQTPQHFPIQHHKSLREFRN